MSRSRINRLQVIELANRNHIARVFVDAWREGYIEWEECCQSIAFHLVAENENLMRRLTVEELNRPAVFHISSEDAEKLPNK